MTVFIAGMVYPTIASDSLLKEIRFEKISDKQEKVFIVVNGFYPPEIFAIEGEKPRVFCDFLNMRLAKAVKRSIKTGGKIIQQIRVGIHLSPTPKIRVVLDLVPNQDYDIKQMFFQKENIFAISACLKAKP